MTIPEAIKAVLKDTTDGLSVEEVYLRILERRLYNFKAADPKAVVRSAVRRHCLGLDFPAASPVKYFRLVGNDRYALESEDGVGTFTLPAGEKGTGRLPEEAIDDAHKEHLSSLRQELKEKILQNHPAFFERLVIELLIRMGYGGSDPKLGIHTGGPGDGGIDGIIKEDKLGLGRFTFKRSATV